jgi:hypothetical protein
MNRNNRKLLLLSLLACLFLTSCGESSTTDVTYVSSFAKSRFEDRYTYVINPGKDGIASSMNAENPLSLDDTLKVSSYIWDGSSDIADYYTNGSVVMEDSVRTDVKTDWGEGYPIVELGDKCFSSNTNKAILTSIKLSTNIEKIGESAFADLTGLASLNVNELNDLTYIGTDAFLNTPWYSAYLSGHADQAIIFGHVLYGFNGSAPSTYEVPEGITQIAAKAFEGQTNLSSVTLPSSLTTIGANAFASTSLKSITVPSSVTSIGDLAFSSCSQLTSADLGSAVLGNNVLSGASSIKELSYSGNVSVSNLVNSSSILPQITKVTLKGEKAADGALSGLSGLTSLSLKNVKYLGAEAFSGLTSLSSISDVDSVEFLADSSIKSTPFYNALSNGPVYFGKCFVGFKGPVTAISLKADTTGVSAEAFKEYSYDIQLPSSLKYIGENAFNNCKTLINVSLPNAIEVKNNAFAGTTRMKSFALADNTLIGKTILSGDSLLESLSLPFADDLSSLVGIGDLSTSLTTYNFLKGPTAIPDKMFQGYLGLSDVSFSSTIASIGIAAFRKCSALTKVDLPVTLTALGTRAFAECANLETVNFNTAPGKEDKRVIYNGLENMGQFVFYNDAKFTSSTLNGAEKVEGVFYVPQSVKNVNADFLMGTGITKIVLTLLDYYFAGIIVHTDIRDDQKYITFSKDWNADPSKPADKYGNPYTIPYEIVLISE